MDELLTRLLEARSAVIADVSADGAEMLVRWDDSGSMQLYRLPVAGGELSRVTSLTEPVAAARYIGGTNDAVVAVDRGGDENYQLWRVDLRDGALRELVVEPGVKHDLGAVSRGRRERRLHVDAPQPSGFRRARARPAVSGASRIVVEGGANMVETFSPDGRWLTVFRLDGEVALSGDLLLIDLHHGDVRTVVERTGAGTAHATSWYPDSASFLFSTDAGRDTAAIARYSIENASWTYVLEGAWDSEASLSADGRSALVVHAEDAVTRLHLHDAETFALTRELHSAGSRRGLCDTAGAAAVAVA